MSLNDPIPSALWSVLHWPAPAALLVMGAAADSSALRLVQGNPALSLLTGQHGTGQSVADLLHFDTTHADWIEALDLAACKGQAATCCLKAYRRSTAFEGEREAFWAELHLVPVMAPLQTLPGHLLLTVRDKTPEVRLQQALDAQYRLCDTVTAEVQEAVVVIDSALVVNRVNQAAADMLGCSSAEAVGRPVADVLNLVKADDGEPMHNPLVLAMMLGQPMEWTDGLAVVWPNGSRQAVSACTRVVRDPDQLPVEAILVMRSVADTPLALASMLHQAGHDAVTGLALRPVFEDRLSQAIALCRRYERHCGLLLIAVGGIEAARMAHGHAATDAALLALVQRMREAFRRSDTLCRLGDDRLAAVLPQIEAEVGPDILVRKAQACAAPGPFTLHISVALSPQAGDSVAALLLHAEAHLAPAA
ncbi:MAG: hypothetical protein RLZZ401_89 [Pseudomonadota bacterium]